MERITIIMEGGIVHDVQGIPAGVEVAVHDYDIEGFDEEEMAERVVRDNEGREHSVAIWGGECAEASEPKQT